MSQKKSKFYVVWQGHHTGVFSTWESCQQQIIAYPAAKYKSFESRAEAEQALIDGPSKHIGQGNKNITKSQTPFSKNYIQDSIAVDGAWNTRTGAAEYQGVYVKTGQQLFHQGPFADGTNNIVEFLGLVHALAFLKQRNMILPIYTDSKTAMAWLRQKKCKTTMEAASHNRELFELIARAEKWLATNDYKDIPVLKWETEQWGENPADFGRK